MFQRYITVHCVLFFSSSVESLPAAELPTEPAANDGAKASNDCLLCQSHSVTPVIWALGKESDHHTEEKQTRRIENRLINKQETRCGSVYFAVNCAERSIPALRYVVLNLSYLHKK